MLISILNDSLNRSDKMSGKYMICVVGGIPHVATDPEAIMQLEELSINMIECESELPELGMISLDYDIFGDQVLISSLGAIMSQAEQE
tara:strand:+ start:1264 stop:1527 length:264 start_codon:yes stop_codon:yes gene_type:complete